MNHRIIYLLAVTVGLSLLTVYAQSEFPEIKFDVLENLINCVEDYNSTASQLDQKKSDHKHSEGRSNCLESCFKELRKNRTKSGVLIEKVLTELSPLDSSAGSLKAAVISCAKDRNAEGVDDCKSTKQQLECLQQKIDCPNKNECILRILVSLYGAAT